MGHRNVQGLGYDDKNDIINYISNYFPKYYDSSLLEKNIINKKENICELLELILINESNSSKNYYFNYDSIVLKYID